MYRTHTAHAPTGSGPPAPNNQPMQSHLRRLRMAVSLSPEHSVSLTLQAWRRRALEIAAALAMAGSLVALSACSATGTLNALTPSAAQVRTGVAYGALPRQELDIYLPSASAPSAGWPVVVFFYGGSWNTGQRADYAFVGQALASRGMLALVADYRLYPQVRYPDFLRDSAHALQWGLDNAARLGGDPKRVFVMGHSAGGYNAAMLALDQRWLGDVGHRPSELAGWIGLAGPYDLFPTRNPDVQPVFFHPDYPPNSEPIDFIRPDAPPSFVAAPEHDAVVNPARSTRQLAQRLQAAGAVVVLKTYANANHVTLIGAFAWPLRFIAPVLDDVAAFVHATPPAV